MGVGGSISLLVVCSSTIIKHLHAKQMDRIQIQLSRKELNCEDNKLYVSSVTVQSKRMPPSRMGDML